MQVIAIDGPGGSGKSTVSKALAARLGLSRLDTGAMYRAVALCALRNGVDLDDGESLATMAKAMKLVVEEQVLLNGEDVSLAIRSPEVDAAVSFVARQPLVRIELVQRQREWAQDHHGGVIEGRDIASVVFPDASLKIYLTASEQARATRRAYERAGDQELADDQLQKTKDAIAHRDEIDTSREASPLVVADGAITIDSTNCAVDEVVERIMELL